MGKKATFGNNVVLTPDECDTLKHYAVNGIIADADNKRLKENWLPQKRRFPSGNSGMKQ